MPPVAMAIGMGVAGVATHLAGAKMASNASKDAAKMQVAATDKAQGYTDRAYADQKAAMNPYMQGGQQVFNSMVSQYGGQPLRNPYAPMGGTGGGQPQPPQMSMGQPPQGQPPMGGGGMPPGGMPGAGGMAPQGGPQGQPMAQGQPMGGGGMVRVKAPTGEIAMLPDGPQLQMALQKGAVRL